MASIIALSTLFSLTLAQTTVLTLPFMGYEDTKIVASVVSVKPGATALQLACPEGVDASDCGLFPSQTLIYGPSTYHMDMSEPGHDFTMTQDCGIKDKTAVCTESASGAEADFPGSSVETYEGGGWTGLTSLPVTVTKGADKLKATADGSSAGPSASIGSGPSGTAASQTGTSATPSSSASGSQSASNSGSAAPAQSTGGASAQAIALKGGLIGAAAGLFGGLLL